MVWYEHLFFFFFLSKGRDEKSVCITFFAFWSALMCMGLYSHSGSRWRREVSVTSPTSAAGNRDTVRCRNVSQIPDVQMSTWNHVRGAEFLQTNRHLLTPHGWMFSAKILRNGALVACDAVHISGSEAISVCSFNAGDISQSLLTLAPCTRTCARAWLGRWQMPRFHLREWPWRSSCGTAPTPWGGGLDMVPGTP